MSNKVHMSPVLNGSSAQYSASNVVMQLKIQKTATCIIRALSYMQLCGCGSTFSIRYIDTLQACHLTADYCPYTHVQLCRDKLHVTRVLERGSDNIEI